MSFDKTFLSNIVTSSAVAGEIPLCGQIRVSGGGTFYFEDKHILVDGPKWVAVDYDYDFESLTHKTLRRVKSYKAQWAIKLRMFGRQTMNTLMDLESLMEITTHDFDNRRGVIPARRFYLTPPGDETRPTLEVVKVSSPDVDTAHYAERYLGYAEHGLVVESVQLFETKRLPRVEPIPTVLPDDGILSTSWASPDIEVYA